MGTRERAMESFQIHGSKMIDKRFVESDDTRPRPGHGRRGVKKDGNGDKEVAARKPNPDPCLRGQITEEDLDSLPTPFATTLTAEGKSMVEAGEPVRFEIFINLRGIGWATCWTENYHDEDEQD